MNMNMQMLDEALLDTSKTLGWKWIPYPLTENRYDGEIRRDR